MSKTLSEKEKQLNKKYLPVNIVVCVLCIVAMITLFVTPVIRIDFGEVLRDGATSEYVSDMLDESLNGGSSEGESDEINFVPVISKILNRVLKKAEGSLSLTASGAMSVAFSSGDEKGDKALDDLLYGKTGLVPVLVSSLVDGVFDVFMSKDGRRLIEEAVVSTLINSVLSDVPGLKDHLGGNAIDDLTNTLKKIETEDVNDVIDEFSAQLGGMLGDDVDMTELKDIIKDMYEKADEKTDGPVTFENIICAAISSTTDLSEFNIGDVFNGMFGDGNNESNDREGVNNIARAYNGDDQEEQGGGFSEEERSSDEEQDNETGEQSGDGDNSGENDNTVTSFSEIMKQMGFDAADKAKLKKDLQNTIENALQGKLSEISDYLQYYQYLFYAMLVFIVLWLIQFIFAFVHIFKPNKRFRMWYTKLLCWIPSIIWLALALLPVLLPKFAPGMLDGKEGGIIKALLNGVGSFTWINGLCYILIWACSIWMFVLKRKIRKQLAADSSSDSGKSVDGVAQDDKTTPNEEAAASSDSEK